MYTGVVVRKIFRLSCLWGLCIYIRFCAGLHPIAELIKRRTVKCRSSDVENQLLPEVAQLTFIDCSLLCFNLFWSFYSCFCAFVCTVCFAGCHHFGATNGRSCRLFAREVCVRGRRKQSACVCGRVCVCVCVCGSVSAALPCSMTSSVDDHVTQYVIVASHRWQPASSTHLHQSAHQHWALPIPVHSTCKLLLPRRRRSRRRHNTNERASYYCANHYRALNEHTHTHTHTHTYEQQKRQTTSELE